MRPCSGDGSRVSCGRLRARSKCRGCRFVRIRSTLTVLGLAPLHRPVRAARRRRRRGFVCGRDRSGAKRRGRRFPRGAGKPPWRAPNEQAALLHDLPLTADPEQVAASFRASVRRNIRAAEKGPRCCPPGLVRIGRDRGVLSTSRQHASQTRLAGATTSILSLAVVPHDSAGPGRAARRGRH